MFKNLMAIIGLVALTVFVTTTFTANEPSSAKAQSAVAESTATIDRPSYIVSLSPDLYLPSLAESKRCQADIVLGFGFSENRVKLMQSPMFYGPEKGDLVSQCFLFRDVHGPAAHKMVADIMQMFVEQDFWMGIPSDIGNINLVQSKENANHIAFSFLNEDTLLGPYAGIAGFDLADAEGLRMYLWSYNRYY